MTDAIADGMDADRRLSIPIDTINESLRIIHHES